MSDKQVDFCRKRTWHPSELINSIEITIAIDIFGAIAIVKRISQLLLLLLIRSSISIDFFLVWNMPFLNFCSGNNRLKPCKSDNITFKIHKYANQPKDKGMKCTIAIEKLLLLPLFGTIAFAIDYC